MGRRKKMEKKFIKRTAEKCLRKWKNTLGFSDWKFRVRVTTFRRADGFLQDGDFVANYSKKQATILIGRIIKTSIKEVIVHELVHLALGPLDQKAISAIRAMPKYKAKRIEEEFLGRLEKVVARITKALIAKRTDGKNK